MRGLVEIGMEYVWSWCCPEQVSFPGYAASNGVVSLFRTGVSSDQLHLHPTFSGYSFGVKVAFAAPFLAVGAYLDEVRYLRPQVAVVCCAFVRHPLAVPRAVAAVRLSISGVLLITFVVGCSCTCDNR